MNVGETLKYDTKAKLTQSITKIQVLRSYLKEAETEVQEHVNNALKELGVDPKQYLLEMNPQTNTWLLKQNPKAILANSDLSTETPVPVRPAGDTEEKGQGLQLTEELKVT